MYMVFQVRKFQNVGSDVRLKSRKTVFFGVRVIIGETEERLGSVGD